MMVNKFLKSAILLLPVCAFFAAAPAAQAKVVQPINIEMGKNLYLSYCVLCHGDDGKTNGPLTIKMQLKPSDLTAPKLQTKTLDELTVIIGGSGGPRRAESKMPVWEKAIPLEVLKSIGAYVLTFSSAEPPPAKDCSKKAPEEAGVPRGKTVFDSACKACHGRFGNGKGLLAELIGLHDTKGKPMVDWTKPGYKKRPEEIKKAIFFGQGDFMPAWKDTLCENEAEDIVSYIGYLRKNK